MLFAVVEFLERVAKRVGDIEEAPLAIVDVEVVQRFDRLQRGTAVERPHQPARELAVHAGEERVLPHIAKDPAHHAIAQLRLARAEVHLRLAALFLGDLAQRARSRLGNRGARDYADFLILLDAGVVFGEQLQIVAIDSYPGMESAPASAPRPNVGGLTASFS